jgi:hypothetical protein
MRWPAIDNPAGVGSKRIARSTATPNNNPQFALIQLCRLLDGIERLVDARSAMVIVVPPQQQ